MKWNISFLVNFTITGNTWEQNANYRIYRLSNIHDQEVKWKIKASV